MRHERGLPNSGVGLVAVTLTAAIAYLAFGGSLPFRDDFTVRAAFKTTNNLRVAAPVRLAGVEIGEVTAVERLREGGEGAIVEMRIEDEGLPLHRDAEFTIRPRLFLEGNFFVDVEPGTADAGELAEGDTVPVNQTSTPVQLGQVLAALGKDTRQDAQVLLAELDRALARGGARGFNRSLRHWGPAFRRTAAVAGAAAGERDGDLEGFVRGTTRVARALDRDGEALKALIADAEVTARALAAEDERLEQTVGELPRALSAARPALKALNASFPPARRLAAELRPGVRAALPAVRALRPLAGQLIGLLGRDELRGAARDLRPAVPDLARVLRDGRPALAQLRLAAGCATEVVLPWANDRIDDEVFPASGKVYEEIPKSLPGFAGESRSGDANGQWVRTLAQSGIYAYPAGEGSFMFTSRPLMGVNPPPPQRLSPLRPDVPCETQEPPDLRTIPDSPPEGFRVDQNSPEARAMRELSHAEVVPWARKLLRRAGLDDRLAVSDEVLELSDLSRIGGGTP